MRGIFITFEGIEGSGKSTMSKKASEYISTKGYSVTLTHEPGDTGVGEKIRHILLDPLQKDMHPLTELLLYFADRAEHVQKVIHPAMEKGDMVICDRFSDSTIAYQGYGRDINLVTLKNIDSIARKGLCPDLTIILDLDVKKGLQRNSLTTKRDRFEMEEVVFHEKVRRGYLRIAEEERERVKVVDASRPIDVVFNEVKKHLNQKIIRQ